ncbi:MAG: tRNA-dihydrouridine synthase [Archaeoglobales archaeon]|nr:tRNA-dihydrouridine synthase [Archaeoglobales archaeon]
MSSIRFENRVVLAPMAGLNNAEFCNKQKAAALVILGGFNADEETLKAAKKVTKRGRKEFIFDDPIDGIEEEIKNLKKSIFAVNVRSATIEGYLEAARVVADYKGIFEINAHCRQPEFLEIGCGEALLYDKKRLVNIVEKVSEITITSVKIRAGHKIDYEEICKSIFNAGAKILHVDAMIPNAGCDLILIQKLSRFGFLIGNNSFVDAKSGENFIKAGAKMVSAARAVLSKEKFFEEVLRESALLSQPVELKL